MRHLDIHCVLRVDGKELTPPRLRTLYESSSALIESGVRELVLDLSDVTYIDSASLGCLIDICRRMSRENGVVKLIGLRERVRALAVMAGLTRHIEVFNKSNSGEDLAPWSPIGEKCRRQ